jgi:hypothetical protein
MIKNKNKKQQGKEGLPSYQIEKGKTGQFEVLCSLFFALFVSNYDKLQVGWALG